jgi:hypothetical protein
MDWHRHFDSRPGPVLRAEGDMLELSLIQLPDVSASVVTVAWIAGGALALLLIWEVATFAAYVIGVGDRDRHD